jgi:sialate O-acetylesterase
VYNASLWSYFMKSVLVLLCALSLQAASLRVTGGAADDQVFQRGADNRADITVSGAADPNGKTIEARLVRKHITVSGYDWLPMGKVAGGQFTVQVKGVPAGGPYRIDLRIAGTEAAAAIHNVLVGDLWVLAGQSNMEGVGDLIDTTAPDELVHNLDMADRWVVAEEPLHTLQSATDRVHWRLNAQKQPERWEGERLAKFISERKKGAGLGLPFAVEMVRANGIPVGLLSCAHGGTSMDQWNPALKDKGGDSLYGSMLRRVRLAGGKVKGMLWYQGESDASPKAAPEFQAKFERLVTAIRDDFGQPQLPFYYVQIGRHVAPSVAEWNTVQDMQLKAERTIPNSGVVAAIDTSLDDGIHVGTQDLKLLGKRLANLALGRTRRGPRPVSATFANGMVRVAFSEVNEKLTSAGRLSGFSIHAGAGEPLPLIYKARIDPADPTSVLLSIGGKLPEGAVLRYGYGKDPYCNLRDEAGMGAPVFGPMAIQ